MLRGECRRSIPAPQAIFRHTRKLTPGSILEAGQLEPKQNNFLAAVAPVEVSVMTIPLPLALMEAVTPGISLELIWNRALATVLVLVVLLRLTVAVWPAALVMVKLPWEIPLPPLRVERRVLLVTHCLWRLAP